MRATEHKKKDAFLADFKEDGKTRLCFNFPREPVVIANEEQFMEKYLDTLENLWERIFQKVS